MATDNFNSLTKLAVAWLDARALGKGAAGTSKADALPLGVGASNVRRVLRKSPNALC